MAADEYRFVSHLVTVPPVDTLSQRMAAIIPVDEGWEAISHTTDPVLAGDRLVLIVLARRTRGPGVR
jgi:hypothetical protein